jgi:hypothetical protein
MSQHRDARLATVGPKVLHQNGPPAHRQPFSLDHVDACVGNTEVAHSEDFGPYPACPGHAGHLSCFACSADQAARSHTVRRARNAQPRRAPRPAEMRGRVIWTSKYDKRNARDNGERGRTTA